MQELRFVAVSEDGSYAVLAVPGRSGRYILPIDERLRAVALGQTSRLAQYEIEVESPLRPKEIQARIRAGETAEEIADAAGIPVERVRWFEGPVLAERAYIAEQAQAASVRRAGDAAGPGPRLGDVVPERLNAAGSDPADAQWDSRKRGDGNWQVTLTFPSGGRLHVAEWVFDPRRRHVMPDDDNAARLSLPESELPPVPVPVPGEATVTPIASRLGTTAGMGAAGMGAAGMGVSGGSFAGPGHANQAHAGGGFGQNRFRPERSVIPDRSLGTDRSLAADRSRTAARPPAPERPAERPATREPAAPERQAAADYAEQEYAVTDYLAATEHAALTERPAAPDRTSLAYSPAATPVLPRPASPAQEPPPGGQVAARPGSSAQPPAPGDTAFDDAAFDDAAFDDMERVRPAPARQVVFEDPEPGPLDEQLELGQGAEPATAEPASVEPAATAVPADAPTAAAEPVQPTSVAPEPEPVAPEPEPVAVAPAPAAARQAATATAAAEVAEAPKVAATAPDEPAAQVAGTASDEPAAQVAGTAADEPAAAAVPAQAAAGKASEPAAADAAKPAEPAPAPAPAQPAAEEQPARPRPGKKSARGRRSSVPSWDEIMLGSSRQRD